MDVEETGSERSVAEIHEREVVVRICSREREQFGDTPVFDDEPADICGISAAEPGTPSLAREPRFQSPLASDVFYAMRGGAR